MSPKGTREQGARGHLQSREQQDLVQQCASLLVVSPWDALSFLFTRYFGNGTINNLSLIGWHASDLSVKAILTGQVSGQKARNAVLGNSQQHNYKINTLFSGQILSSGKRLPRFVSIEHRSQITLLSRISLAVGSLHLCPQIFPFMLERRPALPGLLGAAQLRQHYSLLAYLHINETLINI